MSAKENIFNGEREMVSKVNHAQNLALSNVIYAYIFVDGEY
jgi:hypothetical protein